MVFRGSAGSIVQNMVTVIFMFLSVADHLFCKLASYMMLLLNVSTVSAFRKGSWHIKQCCPCSLEFSRDYDIFHSLQCNLYDGQFFAKLRHCALLC